MASAATKAVAEPKTLESQQNSPFSSPGKRDLILCLLLALGTLAVYNPVSHFDFTNFDDDHYVYENSHVRAGLTWQTVSYAFHTHDAGNWHPLTWLSHALDYQLFHLNPAGHHYVNVLLHVLNTILLFLLLQRGTGLVWRSLMVAAMFGLHPLNVESVAWISERKNVLCTLFFFLALASYGWYVKRPGLKRYGLVALAFTLALMSKPLAITFPFVLLLLDYWPLGRMAALPSEPVSAQAGTAVPSSFPEELKPPSQSFGKLALEKLPLLVLAVGGVVSTIIAQRAGGAISSGSIYALPVRLENAIFSYALYLWKAMFPIHLAIMYPHPGNSLAGTKILASASVLILLTAAVVVLKTRRYLAVGWCCYLGIMVPMIGLIQVGRQGMADRYAYIPLVGIFIAVIWGVADAASHWRVSTKYLALPALAVLSGFAMTTRTQVSYWHDSVSLWSHAVSVTQNNFIAHDNLGEAEVTQGQYDEAIKNFRRAAQIEPNDPVAQINLGVLERRQRKASDAIAHYESVLRLTTDRQMRARAFTNLGSAYRTQGDFGRARQNYEAALQSDQQTALAWLGLGLIAYKTGDFSHSVEYYSHATNIEPSDVGFLLMASALQQQGKFQEAKDAASHSKQLSRDWNLTQQTASKLILE